MVRRRFVVGAAAVAAGSWACGKYDVLNTATHYLFGGSQSSERRAFERITKEAFQRKFPEAYAAVAGRDGGIAEFPIEWVLTGDLNADGKQDIFVSGVNRPARQGKYFILTAKGGSWAVAYQGWTGAAEAQSVETVYPRPSMPAIAVTSVITMSTDRAYGRQGYKSFDLINGATFESMHGVRDRDTVAFANIDGGDDLELIEIVSFAPRPDAGVYKLVQDPKPRYTLSRELSTRLENTLARLSAATTKAGSEARKEQISKEFYADPLTTFSAAHVLGGQKFEDDMSRQIGMDVTMMYSKLAQGYLSGGAASAASGNVAGVIGNALALWMTNESAKNTLASLRGVGPASAQTTSSSGRPGAEIGRDAAGYFVETRDGAVSSTRYGFRTYEEAEKYAQSQQPRNYTQARDNAPSSRSSTSSSSGSSSSSNASQPRSFQEQARQDAGDVGRMAGQAARDARPFTDYVGQETNKAVQGAQQAIGDALKGFTQPQQSGSRR